MWCIVSLRGFFMKTLKYYGRKDVNRLDWCLALSCVIIALGAVWYSIGLSITNTGYAAAPAFRIVLSALTFKWATNTLVLVFGIVIYAALLYSIVTIACLCATHKKNRIPGVVTTLLSLLASVVFVSLIYQFSFGASKDLLSLLFPLIEIGFVAYLVLVAFYCVYAVFSKRSVELSKATKEENVAQVIEEIEKEPEHVEEEPQLKPEPEKEPEPEPEPQSEPEPEPKQQAEPEEDSEETEEGEEGFSKLGPRRRKIPFESKLKKADHDTFERYDSIVKAIRAYDVNDRISIPGETFSYKREKIVFVTFAGNTLRVYFALDPKSFKDSPIPVRDVSDVKKFEQTPCMLVVKSNLAARRAILLARTAFMRHDVPRK